MRRSCHEDGPLSRSLPAERDLLPYGRGNLGSLRADFDGCSPHAAVLARRALRKRSALSLVRGLFSEPNTQASHAHISQTDRAILLGVMPDDVARRLEGDFD